MKTRFSHIRMVICLFIVFGAIGLAFAGLSVGTPTGAPNIVSISQSDNLEVTGMLDPRTQATVHCKARCFSTPGQGWEFEDDFPVVEMTKAFDGAFGEPDDIWDFAERYTLTVTVTGDTVQREFDVTPIP